MLTLLAETAIDLPLSDTMQSLVGLIGVMTLAITVLTFWLLIKKVFGRNPPLDKEFTKLRSEIYETTNRAKKEMTKDLAVIQSRAEQLETEIEEIKMDRERKWQSLQGEIHALDIKIAKLMSNVEFIIRRMDREDTK